MKEKLKSIRMKLFLTLCITLVIIILLLIIINSFVLETFYLYSKQKKLLVAYELVNNYYQGNFSNMDLELELERISINNDFDIIIKNDRNETVYSTNKSFSYSSIMYSTVSNNDNSSNIIFHKENIQIIKVSDEKSGLNFMILSSRLDNGYFLYMRVAITSIQESVKISNDFLCLIGAIVILISGIIVSMISKHFTKPIAEISEIADHMSKLDFSRRYEETGVDDEINKLGKSINIMSDKLEKTITRLRQNNMELERGIEEKSKIDEMRKQFISDVSHELKTPIALIQGYAEGLVENVVTDEESKKFYANVILDEAEKMDKLVKRLLELMKLEYCEKKFEDKEFDIIELIKEVIRKQKMVLEEKNINVILEESEPIYVIADDFYIEQVVNNYFTNAIKNTKEVAGKREIKISIIKNGKKVKIGIANTGEQIKEEDILRIWNRFYKVDESRNRNDGGTGIGLAIVKAIMNNYGNEYGVKNLENGVEFYFELKLK